MLETLIANGDFPEDEFRSSVDPNADTVLTDVPILEVADSEDEFFEPPLKAVPKQSLPGDIVDRLLRRHCQGSYVVTQNRMDYLFR